MIAYYDPENETYMAYPHSAPGSVLLPVQLPQKMSPTFPWMEETEAVEPEKASAPPAKRAATLCFQAEEAARSAIVIGASTVVRKVL